ncbi:MAG: hypothetical protein HIU83_00980 [Proteobacteria bacterium]|nr:hypothetical protein [Pseudomonadota bacterium]
MKKDNVHQDLFRWLLQDFKPGTRIVVLKAAIKYMDDHTQASLNEFKRIGRACVMPGGAA